MTAFTDFVSLLRLSVNIYHNAKVCGNWEIKEHTLGATCFHIVTTGQCRLQVPGHLETDFNQGDLVIFPRELEHRMWHIHNTKNAHPKQKHLPYSTTLEGTGMLCGEVRFLHLYRNQLLNALPPVLFIRNDKSTPWLASLADLMLLESESLEQPDSITLNRLSELLFIYALRHYLNNHVAEAGLLALYADDKIARALKTFHKKPEAKWDLNSLAKAAGMSRTLFSESFKRRSGWTVNQYTTWWRMQLAWESLRLGTKVAEVALKVGYQSEAAFSRAFRRQFEISAGQVRRNQSLEKPGSPRDLQGDFHAQSVTER